MLLAQFPLTFHQIYNGDASIHWIAYFCSDWGSLHDHLRDVSWEDVFRLSASAAASEFCKWVQVGIDACTPHHKYQVKPRISPWFSAACAPVILQRNHFFVRINRVNLLNLK